MGTARILLVGEGLNRHSQLAQCLADWGVERQFASSGSQACALLKKQAFDLIISRLKLADGPASQMIPLLEGSPATLFCSQPVATDCWWLPIIERGIVCWGAPGLRAKEFGELLHRMVARDAATGSKADVVKVGDDGGGEQAVDAEQVPAAVFEPAAEPFQGEQAGEK
jgi:hypothetical protein